MQILHFTIQEKNTVIPFMESRLKHYLSECSFDKKQEKIYVAPLKSALTKLSADTDSHYSQNEKICLWSCINENISYLYKAAATPSTLMGWLDLYYSDKKAVNNLDAANSILLKSGYFKKKNIYLESQPASFSSTFEKIRKMMSSEIIFLSKVGNNDYYKIAFVYNSSELLECRFKNSTPLNSIFFQPKHCSTIEYGHRRYTDIVNRIQAKETLETVNNNSYPREVIPFMLELLKVDCKY